MNALLNFQKVIMRRHALIALIDIKAIQ